jgi:acetyl esterase/lipase
MPAEAVAALGEALDAAGLVASNQVYPGAVHGYTMADTRCTTSRPPSGTSPSSGVAGAGAVGGSWGARLHHGMPG